MADLVKAYEADLFGAFEWAADFYGELIAVPQLRDRVQVLRGLLRALEGAERHDDATAAADDLVAAEEEAGPSPFAALDAAREALLDAKDVAQQAGELGPAFLAAFEAADDADGRPELAADAVLAALVTANLVASRRGDPEAMAQAHQTAARLYERAAAAFEARVQAGELLWQITARSAWHRAMVAWRAAGDEGGASRAEAQARALGAGAGQYH